MTLFLRCVLNAGILLRGRFFCTSSMASGVYQEKFNIKTFIFFDIETTGLPSYENNKTRIIELSMVAVQSNHLRVGVYPRVQNKLNLCFNPQKLISSESEKMTGLSNYKLEDQFSFNEKTVNIINNFIDHNTKPVCFVAHNGNNFDYPILKKEIISTNVPLTDQVYYIDSLILFRDLYSNDEKGTTNLSHNIPEDIPISPTNECFESVIKTSDEVDKGNMLKATEAQKINETTPQKQIIVNGNGHPFERMKKLRKEIIGTSVQITDEVQVTNHLANRALTDIPIELMDGYDELLLKISDEVEKKVADAQKQNETTPQKQIVRNTDGQSFKRIQGMNAKKRVCYGTSFKLVDVYTRLTKKRPENAHQAEADVQMLINCAATLGDKFVDWADSNAKEFIDVYPMRPGHKLGT